MRSNFRARMLPPGAEHWFGTDHFGRDLLSRVMYGGRASLEIGFFVVVVTGIAGTTIGALAGYFRRLDNPLMRLMDALMAFPAILLAIVISAVLGASITNVVIALSIATSPHTARIVRGSVLVVREMEYVEAGRALGASDLRLLFGHVLINAMAPLIVRLTYVFAIAILAEAVLSYIGVGPPPPTPTFGNIIAGERDFHGDGALGNDFSGVGDRCVGAGAEPAGGRPARRARPPNETMNSRAAREGSGAVRPQRGPGAAPLALP